MMISILHKLLSTGTVAAKGDMEEVLLGAAEESRACMGNHIRGTGLLHRQTTTTIQLLQRTRVHSHSSTRHPVERALLPEDSVLMGVLGRRNHRRTLSNFPALELATMVAFLMCLGALNRTTRDRIQGLALTWANRAVAMTRSATMVIRPKYLVAPVLRQASPEDVLDLLQMCLVRQDCHNPKGKAKVKVNKATVDTWAIRFMVSKVRSMEEAQEAWAADTTNLEDRITKPVVMELTDLGMGPVSMETAIAVDGGPIMGTKF